MAFRATLSVVLGCNFGSAARLLSAAEAGQEQVVAQVRGSLSGMLGAGETRRPRRGS